MVRTLCKECVFATHEEDIQVGCELGRLEKYKLLGCVVDAEEVETGKKSFVIDNRYCLACRNKDWGEKIDEEKWVEVVREEMLLQFQSIVFHNKGEEELKKTIGSMMEQSLPPEKIIIVSKPDSVYPPEKLVEYMDSLGIEWKIQNILQPRMKDAQCIDIVQDIAPKQYYAVFYAGFLAPKDFFKTINDAVNESMLQFAMLSPNSSGNGMVVSSTVHRYYYGNSDKSLQQKMEEDGCLENIIPITTIFPNFPE